MAKKEAPYTTKMTKGLREAGHFVYKLPDPQGSGFGSDVKNKFTAKRPFDVVACINGKLFAIECKYMDKAQSFRPIRLAPHQHDNLRAVLKAKGKSLVVLFLKHLGRVRLIPFKYSEFNRSFGAKELLERPYVLTKGLSYPTDWLTLV